MLGPIPLLGDNADGVGVLNTFPEIDGVVRRMPLLMRIGEDTYPTLAVEVIRVATGAPSYQIKANQGGVEAVRVPGYPVVKTDPNSQIWLRWNKQFETKSIAADDFSFLEGKTVIIGSQAEGIGGIIATPRGSQYNFMPAAITLQTPIYGDPNTETVVGSSCRTPDNSSPGHSSCATCTFRTILVSRYQDISVWWFTYIWCTLCMGKLSIPFRYYHAAGNSFNSRITCCIQ